MKTIIEDGTKIKSPLGSNRVNQAVISLMHRLHQLYS
jgi:hypothetical protein